MGKLGARRDVSWGTRELLFVFLASALIGYTAIGWFLLLYWYHTYS